MKAAGGLIHTGLRAFGAPSARLFPGYSLSGCFPAGGSTPLHRPSRSYRPSTFPATHSDAGAMPPKSNRGAAMSLTTYASAG